LGVEVGQLFKLSSLF